MKKGFTLLEILLVLSIIGIMTTIAFFLANVSYDKARFNITIKKMDNIVKAFIGDENLIEGGSRVSFGYIGDTKSWPNSLDDLITNPGVSGWNGPYIQREFSEAPNDFKKDGWGNYFIYDTVNRTIISYGSDGEVGGTGYAADITRRIYEPVTNISTNNIRIFVRDRNNVVLTNQVGQGNVSVSIQLPSGWTSLSYNSNGYFEYIPLDSLYIGRYNLTVSSTELSPSSIVSKIDVYPKGASSYSYTLIKFPTALPTGNIFDLVFFAAGSGTTYYLQWTNMPAALTEIFGNTYYRISYDLSNFNYARLVGNVVVAGATNAQIRVQYSVDETNWFYLDGVDGPKVAINTTGHKISTWVNIVSGAKTNVYLRLVGINGNGAADPRFSSFCLQLR
mgnify:CR=1 FL=1